MEASPRRTVRYVALVLVLTLTFHAVPYAALRLPGFGRWSASYFGRWFDYPYRVAGVDADVVIFGDSSAMFDVDPRQMSAALGVKVVNLPNTMSSLVTAEDDSLRGYLSHNRPPRLIVFYFLAWNTNFTEDRTNLPAGPAVMTYDGEEMLVRHGSGAELLRYAEAHPDRVFVFPWEFFRANPLGTVVDRVRHPERTPGPDATLGHHVWDIPLGRMQEGCRLAPRMVRAVDPKALEQLEARYRTASTGVLVYLSPIPGCAGAEAVAGRSYAALGAVAPRILPPGDFMNDLYAGHLGTDAVPEATRELIEAVRPALEAHLKR